MRALVRADASTSIGLGHVARCLALADVLRERGWTVAFACRSQPGDAGSLVRARGYPLISLPAEVASELEDAEACLALTAGTPDWDWLVQDHYGLGRDWQTRLRGRARRILVIDDLADRPHDCDLLLDQNLGEARAERHARLAPDAHRLIGPRYALLRPEFAACRAGLAPRDGGVREILVSFGGGDAPNATGRTLDALAGLDRPDIAVRVVAGGGNPHAAALAERARNLPNTHFHAATDRMAKLMGRADLGIGAPGSSTWERCSVGLPALLLSFAANQEAIGAAAHTAGAARYLGRIEDHDAAAICAALQSLLQAPAELAAMSRRAWALVDGLGAARVAEEMIGLS
ncbi:MAG: UDP-2,4-diacetamido-2,4,6-trideoxy-beta-L-altropyranose hydrolase [Thiobacillaceae bacterium]|jgi:UDP-2,4-diacetamido-2,4,6-trideoxy-beta-L-altropyranose hydrolase|nr:UDP-2,4-diacetamido-2,4,6-trideoxy-beta-L-altropyranose hydrolase [Thiobacillaceae bacterium]